MLGSGSGNEGMDDPQTLWAPVGAICQIRKAGRGIDQAGETRVCLGSMLISKLNIHIRVKETAG